MFLLLLWGSATILFGAGLCVLHRRVPEWGYGPLFLTVGGIVVGVIHASPLFIEIGLFSARFHLSSVLLVPLLLASVLLVYAADGTSRARLLLGGILIVNICYGIYASFLGGLILRGPLLVASRAGWTLRLGDVAAGGAALFVDAILAVVGFQFLFNRCRGCPSSLRFFLVLAGALTLDTFLYDLLAGRGIRWDAMRLHTILGKGFSAAILALPFGAYFRESVFPHVPRPTLDILLPPYDVLGRRVREAERGSEGLRSDFEVFYRIAADLGKDLDLDETLARITREGFRLLDVDLLWIFLYDEKRQELVSHAGPRPDRRERIVIDAERPSLTSLAFRTQETLVSEDPARDARVRADLVARHGDKALLAVPLVSRGISSGTILFSRTRSERGFSERDKALAQALAGHAAFAIGNARFVAESIDLNERLATRERELERYAELERLSSQVATDLLSRAPEALDEAIRDGLRRLGAWAGTDRAYILLYDPTGERIAEAIEWAAPGRAPLAPGVIGDRVENYPWFTSAILRNEILRVDHVDQIPSAEGALRGIVASMGVEAFVCVPLWQENRAIGFLGLTSHRPDPIQGGIDDSLRIFSEILVNGIARRERARVTARRTNRLRLQNRTLIEAASNESLALGNLPEALRDITRAAAEALEVERTSVWFFTEGERGIRCADLYERAPRRHSEGVFLRAADFPAYFRALDENRTIQADDARRDPRTREFAESYLDPLGITSMLDAPIRFRGKMTGVLCNEHVGPARRWGSEEADFAGDLATLVALAMEASERRKAEEEIRSTASILRSTLDSTADGILVVDRTGKIVTTNRRFSQIWGIPDEILVRGDDAEAIRYVLSQLKDPEGFRRRVAELYAMPEADSFDRLEFLDGRVVERASVPQRLGDEPIGRVWSFRDVTHREQAERRLQEAHGDLSTFHSLVTHDLSNFSMTLHGLIERLLDASADPLTPKQTVLLRRADRQAREMSRLAENAKILARLRDDKIPSPGAAAPLRQLLDETLESVRALHFDRPFEVAMNLPPDLAVRNHPFLSNLFLNLLDNAVRHGERAGAPRIEIHAAQTAGGVKITILGGVPPDDEAMRRLFDRYAPGRRSRGSGLGLALVREVVRRIGGEAEARIGAMNAKPVFAVDLVVP